MGDEQGAGTRGGGRRLPVRERVRAAREEFEELTGIPVESVSGLERTGDGWTVTLEVLEMRRVPDSVSVLATYTVDLDEDGEVAGYRRIRSYPRGRADRA
ncbi:gas vesicle protein [Marinactinospora rubrisoli]|uniref:Gas vesicle protein n=1 Tax=Marinactinospora rubrisoli TaxID=2715399 RepID=A0ABW2KFQ0_9ACTN